MAKIKKNTNKILILWLAVLVFVVFSASSAKAGGISTNDVIKLLNQSRVASGLKEVKENLKLDQAAQAKADDMVKNDYFAHTSPAGVDPWFWFKKVGYDYKFAGENLAVNYSNAEAQHKAWMNSPTHRKNILNGDYQEVGVAVVKGNVEGKDSLLTVELFGSPLYAVVSAPADEPAVSPETQKVAGEEAVPAEAVKDLKIISPVPSHANANNVEIINLAWMIAMIIFFVALLASPLVILLRSWRFLTSQKIFLKNNLAETGMSKAPA